MSSLRTLKVVWAGAKISASVSQRLAGLFAWRLWFTPWRVQLSDRARQREAGWLASTTPMRIPFAGKELAGFQAGRGPTVLLVHGWGDRASRLGAFVEPLVGAGFRVVAVDLPAHGDSPGRMTNAYDLSAAVRATAQHVGGVYAVVAHSMGGVETLMALRDGMRVQRVVLLASAVRLEHAVDRFSEMFSLPPGAGAGLTAAINRRFGPTVWEDLSADRSAATLTVPALLFHDSDDQQVDPADAQLLARSWRGARLVMTSGLGHDRLVRSPEVVGQAVAFLAAPTVAIDRDDDEASARPTEVRR